MKPNSRTYLECSDEELMELMGSTTEPSKNGCFGSKDMLIRNHCAVELEKRGYRIRGVRKLKFTKRRKNS